MGNGECQQLLLRDVVWAGRDVVCMLCPESIRSWHAAHLILLHLNLTLLDNEHLGQRQQISTSADISMWLAAGGKLLTCQATSIGRACWHAARSSSPCGRQAAASPRS